VDVIVTGISLHWQRLIFGYIHANGPQEREKEAHLTNVIIVGDRGGNFHF
jgi:hypothetical protein